MTAEAFAVSTDGGKTYNAGLTVDGDLITRILTTVGVNADWIKTGALRIEKNGKNMVNMDFDTGEIDMVVKSFSLTSGDTIDSIAKEEADKKCKTFTSTPIPPYNIGDIWMNSSTSDIMTCIRARSSGSYVSSDWQKRNKYIDQAAANTAASNAVNNQTQTDIFNKLTNNGKISGIFMQNNQLYINGTYISTGILKDSQDNTIWNLTTGEIKAKKISIESSSFKLSDMGYMQATGSKIRDSYFENIMIVKDAYNPDITNGKWIGIGNEGILWHQGNSTSGYVFRIACDESGTDFDLFKNEWNLRTENSGSFKRILSYNKTSDKFTLNAGLDIPNNININIYSNVSMHNYEMQNTKINNLVAINGYAPYDGTINYTYYRNGTYYSGTLTVRDGIITAASGGS